MCRYEAFRLRADVLEIWGCVTRAYAFYYTWPWPDMSRTSYLDKDLCSLPKFIWIGPRTLSYSHRPNNSKYHGCQQFGGTGSDKFWARATKIKRPIWRVTMGCRTVCTHSSNCKPELLWHPCSAMKCAPPVSTTHSQGRSLATVSAPS